MDSGLLSARDRDTAEDSHTHAQLKIPQSRSGSYDSDIFARPSFGFGRTV
jgi:hypothetical protein